LEINHNPGLDWDEGNGLAYAAQQAGFKSFCEFLTFIVNESIKS